MENWIEIFKAGNYPQGNFTTNDLDNIISWHEQNPMNGYTIPITKDHEWGGIAYGWVDKLKRAGNTVLATFKDIFEPFREIVNKKLMPNRSVELMPVGYDQDYNPIGWRFRAVTFLGATTPQIEDLAIVEFKNNDKRRLNFKNDEKVINIDYEDLNKKKEVSSVDTDKNENTTILFQKELLEKDRQILEFQNREKDLKLQLEKFSKDYSTLKQEFEDYKRKSFEKENSDFVDKLINSGKSTPADREKLLKTFNSFINNPEGLETIKNLFETQKSIVEFGKKELREYKNKEVDTFVSSQEVLEYQKINNIKTYAEAHAKLVDEKAKKFLDIKGGK